MSSNVLTVNRMIEALERVRDLGHGDAQIEFPFSSTMLIGGPSHVLARGVKLVETSTDLLDPEVPAKRIVRIHG